MQLDEGPQRIPVNCRASVEAQRLQFGADPVCGRGQSGEALSKVKSTSII
jgi:hypothetical protein